MPGGTVDALNVKISADISKLQSGLKKCVSQLTGLQTTTAKTANKMQSSFSKVGDSIKKVAGIIGAAFAVNEIKKFGKAAIDAASDLAEVQNVVDTVFGSMSDNINAWSQSAMKAFGLSETSAKQFTSTMGAMLKSSGITGKTLETMSINMAALSADMASFYNLDSQTAFNKIRAGISGETEPLKQLGINMSVANLEAYALSKGITKSYQAMSQSEQMLLRYNYLLTVTADAQHDFERTSGGWANQTRILAENFNRLKTIIGQGLIQALTPLLNMLNTLIAKIVEFAQAVAKAFGAGGEDGGMSGLSDDAAGTAEGLEDADKAAKKLNNTLGGIDELNIVGDNANTQDITDQLGNLKPISVYDTVGKGLDGISEKMTGFVDKLKTKLEPVATLAGDIKNAFIDAFDGELGNSLISNLKEGFWGVIELIGAFAEAFDKAWTNNDNGTNFLKAVGRTLNTIIKLANDVGRAIKNALKSPSGIAWMESVIKRWESFWALIDGIGSGLRNAWNDNGAGQKYVESLFSMWEQLNGVIATVQTTLGNVFSGETGQKFFSEIIALATNFDGVISKVAESFRKAWDEGGIGQQIIENIIGSVSNLIGFVGDLMSHFAAAWDENERGNKLMEAFLGLVETVSGHIEIITSIWRETWDNDKTTAIFGALLEIVTNMVEAETALVDNIMTSVEQSGLLQKVLSLIQDILQTILEFASKVSEKYKEMVSEIDWTPLTDAMSKVAEQLQRIWDIIKQLLDGPLGEFAEMFLDAFGAALQAAIYIVAGLVEAIAKTLEIIVNIVEGLIDVFEPAFTKIGEIIEPIKEAISGMHEGIELFAEKVKEIAEPIAELFKNVIGKAIEKVLELVDKLKDGIDSIMDTAKDIKDKVGNAFEDMMTGAKNVMRTISNIGSSVGGLFSGFSLNLPFAASGGVFGAGELFVAREAGPELVGNFGNSTAVMNNDQIVDAVASGVASAMSPLIDAIAGSSGDTAQTVIRGSDLLLVMQRAQTTQGSRISNNFAFGGV